MTVCAMFKDPRGQFPRIRNLDCACCQTLRGSFPEDHGTFFHLPRLVHQEDRLVDWKRRLPSEYLELYALHQGVW